MTNPTRRKHLTRAATILGGLLLVITAAWAAQATGILYPDWSPPTKGTYKEPAGAIGKETKNPWSQTTIASAIDKPVAGKKTSKVGEIVDLSCYLQVGKHGDKHRDCGQKCVKNGQPVGLLLEDGTVYLLIDEEHDPRRDGLTTFRQKAVDYMAYVVTIHGTLTEVGGQKAIFVQGFVAQPGAKPVEVK